MANLAQKIKLSKLLKEIDPSEIDLSGLFKEIRNIRDSIPQSPDFSPIRIALQNLLGKVQNLDNSLSDLSVVIETYNKKLETKLTQKDKDEIENLIVDLKQNISTSLQDLRLELNQRLANHGGGSPNRQMKVNGTDYLTRYTDVNFIGSITAADNNTNKRVDITFASGGSVLTPTGTVNGTNKVFTFTSAPSIVFVDNIPKQKVQSDGTVNWTIVGTTITLDVAPNYDIFAL